MAMGTPVVEQVAASNAQLSFQLHMAEMRYSWLLAEADKLKLQCSRLEVELARAKGRRA
jgi:hypothetical protein